MTRVRCYPVDDGRRWAVAMRTGQVETLIALFDAEDKAAAYTARVNRVLEAR